MRGDQVPTTLREIHAMIAQPPKDFVDSPKPTDLPSDIVCSFSDRSDFTMAPRVAERMVPCRGIMAAPNSPLMTVDNIREVGFYNWWAPTERMFGSLQVRGETVWLVKGWSSQWANLHHHAACAEKAKGAAG